MTLPAEEPESLVPPESRSWIFEGCYYVKKARCLYISRIIPGFILDFPDASTCLIITETYHPKLFVLLRRDEGTSVNGIFTTLTGELDIHSYNIRAKPKYFMIETLF